MDLRAMLAMVLALLLLSTTCLASTCEVACGARAAHPSCHETQSTPQRSSAHAGPAMTMPGCEHAATQSPSCAALQASTCVQAGCGEHLQLLTVERNPVPSQLSVLQVAAIVTVLVFPPSQNPQWRHRANTPPERSSLLVALQTTLRV